MEHEMTRQRRMLVRLAVAAVVLALPAALIAACGGGGFEEETTAAPAEVPDLGAAQLGAGAGPTPIPVTPTPTATPSPKHLSLYDPVWEGTYTVHDWATDADRTENIMLEVLTPELIGEGSHRRRDQGAMFIEGTTGWMALSFVRVDAEIGSLTFQVSVIQTRFDGVLEGDKITGTVQEGDVNKGTFELHANSDKTPQRRPNAEGGGALN